MKRVRWGMIGCGDVTERKSAPAYSQVAGSKLVGVTSRTAASARSYASRHGVERVFETAEDLIHSPDVDAVYIATPPSAHLALAKQVAEAGKPCCVEKPMAMSHGEALEMVRAFEAAAQPLFVAYYRRSLPRFQQVKQWIAAVGEVRHVHWALSRPPTPGDLAGETSWRTDRIEAPGGYFEDLAGHGLDLFDYMLGPIQKATGIARNQQALYKVPDAVSAAWTHESGATGSGFWNFGAATSTDEVQILGSHGTIRFAVFEDVAVSLETKAGIQALEIANPEPIQLHHVEAMMLHLSGATTHPSSGESAARTEWVADQILGIPRGARS